MFTSEALPIILGILALAVVVGLIEPRFLRTANLINILRNSSYLIIISAGQALVIILSGFDLSVGAVVALASITTALSMVGLTEMMPDQVGLIIALGMLAAVVAGGAVGVLNGLCVAFLKVNPFIVTLGTMSLTSGVALYTTTGVPIYGMPEAFTFEFSSLRVFGLPFSIYLTVAIVVLLAGLMKRTKLGRYIYAVGGNEHAARVSGVRVSLVIIVTYTLCSMLAAVTGVLLTARVGSGEGTMGGVYLMESIAAAILGGARLGGGIGRVEFVVLGALFMSLVRNGMNLMRIDSKIQLIVVGCVLVLAVALDRWKRGELKE